MSAVTASLPETPSKKVAAELAKVNMNKNTKEVSATKENNTDDDEPLLTESSRRFVLFPIRYHEVSNILTPSIHTYIYWQRITTFF